LDGHSLWLFSPTVVTHPIHTAIVAIEIAAARKLEETPRSMPAGLSQIAQSNFVRSSAMTRGARRDARAEWKRVISR
jgi:hypothetical protein